MTPWPSRLLSTSSHDAESYTDDRSPPRVRISTQVTDADLIEQAYEIPSLQSSSETFASLRSATKGARRPSGHSRSMSHPFPSLFQSKKKRSGDTDTASYHLTNDEAITVGPSASPSKGTGGKFTRVPDKDLMTGKCMTCDSMVRWPKELMVFRCTVCLTINDLQPTNRGDRQTPNVPIDRDDPLLGGISRRVLPISIEKTNSLIEQCLTLYLSSRLRLVEDPGEGSLPDTSSALSGNSPDLVLPQSRDLDFQDKVLSSDPSGSLPMYVSVTAAIPSMDDTGIGMRRHFSSTPVSSPYWVNEKTKDPLNETVKRQLRQEETPRNIFKLLEEYLITCLTSQECLNASFSSQRPGLPGRATSEGGNRAQSTTAHGIQFQNDVALSEMDAKTLLIGDFAENGAWWTGSRESTRSSNRFRTYRTNSSAERANSLFESVNMKSPMINWDEVNNWYNMVLAAGHNWKRHLHDLVREPASELSHQRLSAQEMAGIEKQIIEAQGHTQRVLLKATESLLKRPGQPLKVPKDTRFLLIILANPLLFLSSPAPTVDRSRSRSRSRSRNRQPSNSWAPLKTTDDLSSIPSISAEKRSGGPGQHSGVIKRVLGLLSNLPNECHHHLVSWFAKYSEQQFLTTTEIVGSFVTYRLTRQHGRKPATSHDPTGGLIPDVATSGTATSAALHAALSVSGQITKKSDINSHGVAYNDDWQIKAAARVMALLFSANNSGVVRRTDLKQVTMETKTSIGFVARQTTHCQRRILPTSQFYNTLLDYSDPIADFEAWEARRGKFTFCQYPFFLSIWAKIQIMEHDARRQMEIKAREAFFDSIMSRKPVNQYLVLRIRRDCLVEDSLKGVSEVVGTGGEEIKKGLRIEFKGEEGIDAGGLRKEWFLLLIRDVFNPEHGMFTYDEDSQVCYFNPNSFETSDQYFLVGVVLGLAIYNSTILDIALPPFAFRKLLAAGPIVAHGAPSHAKPTMTYNLEDLAEFRPSLANGLRQLLEYDGDVEDTFCRDFVADVERYGHIVQVPLCPDGERRPVTNTNRREFVDLYVRYLLDTAVARQFEPFKRGFFTVCGGNALSLFRPEEIELLVRGSDEPLDITSLQAVSTCENWGVPNPAKTEPVIKWFWESFQNADPMEQRKLLSFITGSDRIPAMGAANLVIKLSCLGNDSPRFPVARTCFNMLSLWRYNSRQKLHTMLWRAVHESEGFGLK